MNQASAQKQVIPEKAEAHNGRRDCRCHSGLNHGKEKVCIPSRNLWHGVSPDYAAAGFMFRLASSLRSTSATI